MVTNLDEAIQHCLEVAEKNERLASFLYIKEGNPYYENYIECANEHRQLAEWLKELNAYRESWEYLFATIFEIKSNAENEDVRNLANFLLKYMRIYEKEIKGVNADADSD